MHLTAKVKIYPTNEQTDVLWKLSDQCKSLYNLALSDRKESWKVKKSVNYVEQQNKLPELKKKNPELNIVYSKVLQGVIKKLDANYKSFFALRKNGDNKARPPNFRSRNYFQTLSYNQSGFKIKNGIISFSHNVNDVPLNFEIHK